MLVTKSDLALKHYSWVAKPGDNPRITGHPDSDLFNRGEGYEVLSMIQGVVTALALKTAGDVHKLEQLIADDLPGGIRSRQGVKDWLVANFKKPQIKGFREILRGN